VSTPKLERVIAYVDGFNLYFGLKESGFQRYFWLNIKSLVQNLLKPNQTLVGVKYFTSLVTNNVEKRLRQKAYINTLMTVEGIQIVYGTFQSELAHCNICGIDSRENNEKMTDVNIATHLLSDFYTDQFDMAMLVSGDTDLVPPIKLINESNTNKRVFIVFPPNRVNDELRKFAKGDMVIGRKKLADSQFEDEIVSQEGQKMTRPVTWV